MKPSDGLDRPYVPHGTWTRFKVEAKRQRVPASLLAALLMRNYLRKRWHLDLIPEREEQ